jgi:hypothetical protein
MRSRIAAIVLAVAGLTLCVVTLAQHTVPAASPFSRVVSNFKPAMTTATIDQLRADLQVVDAGTTALSTKALPALAAKTGQSPKQLHAELATDYPQVATGLQQLPAITTSFSGFADLLDAQQSNFRSVAAIPVSGVAPTVIPPALLFVGAALSLLGVALLLRPGLTGVGRSAAALGLVVAVVSLSASLPHKAGDSAQLKAALAPVMTRSAIQTDQADLLVMSNMATQLQGKLLPDTATLLHMTPTQLAGQLTSVAPALGPLFQQLPQIQARFTGLVDLLETNLANWHTASKPSLVVLIRTLLASAVAAILAGGLAMTDRRPRPAADQPVSTHSRIVPIPSQSTAPDNLPNPKLSEV